MWDRLEQIEHQYEALERQMAQPELATDIQQLQTLAREKASLEDVVTKYRRYRATSRELEETRAMLSDGVDEEMGALVRKEVASLEAIQQQGLEELKLALMPRDSNDEKDIIMEIRAGTGGGEASLFAADLFRMYARYAQGRGWAVDIISSTESEVGGFKEIIFEVKGKGTFSRLKYERGVHRVQRVPVTEASGRIHTSTATVAVLPQASEVEVSLNSNDLRIDIYHSGGAGGQNVNKVATAVRITHLPTGIVTICQDERSQLRNKNKALAVLRARLLDTQRRRQEDEMTKERRAQVGSGERAEKIRTYNFPQDRVTDHRVGMTFHHLPHIMEGQIDDIIDALVSSDRASQMEGQLA